MTGLSHDQRRCLASVVLRQGFESISTDGVNPEYWPRPDIQIPPTALCLKALDSWHSQILHLASHARS